MGQLRDEPGDAGGVGRGAGAVRHLERAGPERPFWKRDQATFFEAWRRAVLDIRAANPLAAIVGPSFSNYANTKIGMQDFLLYAAGQQRAAGRAVVARVRLFVRAAGGERAVVDAPNSIGVSRVSINEIVGTGSFAGGQLWQGAGRWRGFSDVGAGGRGERGARVLGRAERAGVNNGENASLDGLLTPDTKQPRSTWWMYEKYGEMAGTVSGFDAGVVKNGAGIVTFDGLSTKEDGVAHVLLGRFETDAALDSSPVEVRLTNLDQVPDLLSGDGQVRVTGERIADTHLGASAGPVTVFSEIMQVVNGELVVPVSQFGASDGYYLTIASTGAAAPAAPAAGRAGGDMGAGHGGGVVGRARRGTRGRCRTGRGRRRCWPRGTQGGGRSTSTRRGRWGT